MPKLVAPDYYCEFRCIADRCRHSCCIGWEIDIDPATREAYRRVPGEFGRRLNAAIEDGDVSTFRLGPGERCPMLSPGGLCELICRLGESALCQICADHPRFRSFFADRTEIGLGLCCEEAARLILSREEPMVLTLLEGGDDAPLPPEEARLLSLRADCISLLEQDTRPLRARLDALLDAVGFPLPEKDWAAVYRGLERLEPAWEHCLNQLDLHRESPAHLDAPLTRFAVYMLYRHLPGALEDDDLPGRVAFCVLSTRVLAALCAARPACTLADCIEYARMYSAEIEYSEENIAALLDALWEAG